MWKQFRNWWKARGDLVHLEALDDRLLADMGWTTRGCGAGCWAWTRPVLAAGAPAPAIPGPQGRG